jgi:biopolymer transport protein ExbB/biopolymer transport protein TolQ
MTLLVSLLGTDVLGFFLMLQEKKGAVSFGLYDIAKSLTIPGWGVVIVLMLMSIYIIAIGIERYMTYNAAKQQSRQFAPKVAQALKTNNIDEAINISDRHKNSHLAMVVASGLKEFSAHQGNTDISGEEMEASKRALQRAIAVKTAELKRGLSGLATVGSTAPFVGLFGTVIGIINAFQGMKAEETAGIAAVAGGISEALVTTAFGILVAVPAVWLFNYFTNKVSSFGVEMDNSASELIDYFIKQNTKQLRG